MYFMPIEENQIWNHQLNQSSATLMKTMVTKGVPRGGVSGSNLQQPLAAGHLPAHVLLGQVARALLQPESLLQGEHVALEAQRQALKLCL